MNFHELKTFANSWNFVLSKKKKCKQEKFLLRMTYEQGLKAERHNKQQVAASIAIYVGLFCYDHRYKKNSYSHVNK